jgi:hypothetical protein
MISGLIERTSFLQYSGCMFFSDFGSAIESSSLGSVSSICGVRLMIHTGLPRHSTVIIWPGSRLPISTSTGAPAALARSDGSMLERKGTSAAIAPTPPTAAVATTSRRLPQSTLHSLLIALIPRT